MEKKLVCLNVKETAVHFGTMIGEGRKTAETRTIRAWNIIRKATGLQPGDRVGIVIDSVLRCVCTFQGTREYRDLEAFRDDYSSHLVPAGSRYDYDPGKGKVGLILDHPE